MSLFRIILISVISFFVIRFLQRLMTPSAMRGDGVFSRGARGRERGRRAADGAIDAEFEDLDEKK
ncbi:MAG: hypothetical protein HY962_10020 [Ignavibacteriae bacterium]|nr:hypothetical protein [Ignavibacteriota bacterium]